MQSEQQRTPAPEEDQRDEGRKAMREALREALRDEKAAMMADIWERVFDTPKDDRPVLDEQDALHAVEAHLWALPAGVEMVMSETVRESIFRDSFVYTEDWQNALNRFARMNALFTIGGWLLVSVPVAGGRAFVREERLAAIKKAFEALLDKSAAAAIASGPTQ